MRYLKVLFLLICLFPISALAAEKGNIDLNAYLEFRAKYDQTKEHTTNWRAHHLGVILNATKGKVQFYSELDWEDTPEVAFKEQQLAVYKSTDDTKSQVLAAWLKYMYHPSLNITVGKFLTPLTFYQQRHFPILNTSVHRPAGTEDLPDNAILGVMLDGRVTPGDWGMRYFVGVAQDWTTQMNDADENGNKPLFGRLEITAPFLPDLTVAFGGMFGRDGRFAYDDTNGIWSSADKVLGAFDFNYEFGRCLLEGAYMYTEVSPLDDSDYYTVGTYLLFRYDLLDWLAPWVMVEYLDTDSRDDLVDEENGTLGLNFQITDFLKVKTEYVLTRQKGENSQAAELSVVSYF